ncbi:ribosome maturation factor RimM [Pleurocapsales cyanobacterium LEGE 06147]|nr:ribosome maturation factor RimM [Pleurocapsales cyanobacterium LEGE 06147]
MTNEWLEVGTIVAPQGLRGELRVYPDSDFPERFIEPGTRWLQHPDTGAIEEVELLEGQYVPGKNLYVIQLAGVDNRDRAEELRGYKLLVDKSDRPSLEDDEYHVSDLVDLEVYHQQTGENIGVVIDILFAGNDLLEIQLHQQPVIEDKPLRDLSEISRKTKRRKLKSKKNKPVTVLIPFVKVIVPVVDLEGGRLEILPPPGLLELL